MWLSAQAFLSRLPMVFNVVILSPHGFFGQQGVLGKPDTGGQVRRRDFCISLCFSAGPHYSAVLSLL